MLVVVVVVVTVLTFLMLGAVAAGLVGLVVRWEPPLVEVEVQHLRQIEVPAVVAAQETKGMVVQVVQVS
jgi:hypothetical protein